MTKKRGAGIGPYKLLVTMLYGKHKWIERDGPTVRLPVPRLANHMRIRAGRLREYTYLLEDWGVVASVRWNPYWVTITLLAPEGAEYRIGETYDGQ